MNTTASAPTPVITEAEAARLTDREELDLGRAQDQLARATNQGSKALARGKISRIERQRRNRADSAWRQNALDETIGLAEARGEEVTRKPASGPLVIASRDGLRRMADLGHITADMLRVGMIYRAGCELRGADLQAMTIGENGTIGHDNDAFVAKRLQRAKLLDFVVRVDRAVALGCIKNPAALQMLRHVAGGGGSISDFGKGRSLARHREALAAALGVACSVFGKRPQHVGESSTGNAAC